MCAGGQQLGGEAVCNIASVLDTMGASHRTQEDVDLSDPSLEMPDRMLSEVKFPILGQRESVLDDDRLTLEDLVFSISEDSGSS
jgi:hypothetical protein